MERRNKTVSSQAKISNMPFNRKFFQPLEAGVSQWHTQTDVFTDEHADSMTKLAQ